MKTAQLIEALQHLAGIFGWNDEDKKEIWEATRGNAEMHRYWVELAGQWRRATGESL